MSFLRMLLLASIWLAGSVYAGNTLVIANQDVPYKTLSREEITGYFTLQVRYWPDKRPVQLVVMPTSTQAMLDFIEEYTGFYRLGFERFYKNMTESSRRRPVIFVNNMEQMLTTVGSESAAIGFIEKALAPYVDRYGVFVVEVR